MFSGKLIVKTDEGWMRTRTRKATLTLEDSDFIETMGDAFKETYSHWRGACESGRIGAAPVRVA